MGDRVSVSFRKDGRESVSLFSHWGGVEFAAEAEAFARKLEKEKSGNNFAPLDRLEPDTVMVDFIRHLTKDMERVESDLYLGKDSNSGDNGDNGHFIIDLKKEANPSEAV